MKEEAKFKSLTYGTLTQSEVFEKIVKEAEGREDEYQIMIGTDSQGFSDETKVVAVIVIWHMGHGGKFFYRTEHLKKFQDFRDKIYNEAQESLDIAKAFVKYMYDAGRDIHTTIHVDIGEKGKTSCLIDEIMGWIRAEGFEAYYKPNSIAASFVADHYSK